MPPYLSVKEVISLSNKLGIKYERRGNHTMFFVPGHTPFSAPLGRHLFVPFSLAKAVLSYQESLSSNSSSSHLMLAAGTALSTKTYTRLGSPPSNSSAPSPPPVLPSSSSDRIPAAKKTSPTSPSSGSPAASSVPPPSPSSPAPLPPSVATSLTQPGATPTPTTPPPRSNTGRAYLSSLETWGPSSPTTPARPSSASVPPPAPTSTTSSESKESPSTRASRIPAASSPWPPQVEKNLMASWPEWGPSHSPSSAPITRPSSSGTQRPSTPSRPTSVSSSSGSKAPSPSSPSRPSSPPSPPRSSSMSESTKNQLSHSEFYKLCQYLESRRDNLTKDPSPRTVIALQASKSMGVPVSENAIKSAFETLGIPLPKKEGNRAFGDRKVHSALRSLARAHVQLCRDLGNHCPPEIELLAQE